MAWQERRLALQEQDVAIMKTVKSELARVPELEKELKHLREDNAFLRSNIFLCWLDHTHCFQMNVCVMKFCFDAPLIACSRDSRENCSLLKEEVEGLRRKLERMEKLKEDLVNMEHEKEVRVTDVPNDNRSNARVQIRAFSLSIFRGCPRSSKRGKI